MTLPLQGITVVALEQAVAAPFATRQLADLGARVLKVERADGGDFARYYDDSLGWGYSSWFVWLNRSKESIALDVKSDDGNRRLQQMLRQADVFVQNLAPGAAERLGCGHDQLSQTYPRLITCSLSGYGSDGPYRDRKAYDLLIQAEAGLISLTGSPEAPAKAGLSVADIAGGMYAYSGVLAALLRRSITGKGSHVEVSLFDCLIEWLSHQVTMTRMLNLIPRRAGAGHATIAPYRPYRCRDGREILVAAQNTSEWERLCSALGIPEIAVDERFTTNMDRVSAADALDEVLGRRILQLDSGDVIERLEQAELAWARINDIPSVLKHEQLVARNRWIDIDTPGGSYLTPRSAINLEGLDPVAGPVPALGEHNLKVFEWLDNLETHGGST